MAVRRGEAGGLNLTLAYMRDGKIVAFRARCSAISHGFTMVAEESAGRTRRAYYPHKVAPGRFTLTVDLLGRTRTYGDGLPGPLSNETTEYGKFNTWLANYMQFMLAEDEFGAVSDFPQMAVACPNRNFFRYGVPLGPIQFGDHVGSMLWRQQITFETTQEPKEYKSNIRHEHPITLSSVDANGTGDDYNVKHFYPSSDQLAGNQVPDFYDTVVRTVADPTPSANAVQDAVKGRGGVQEF